MRKKVKDQKVKKSKVKKMKNQGKDKKQKPLSVFGLLITIIKGIFKSIPKMWKSILIRSAISFFVVTAFSMYSIAMKNEGTGAVRFASGTFWGDAINTGGNEAAFNTMCFIATYALTMIVSRIRNGGLKKFFKDIFGTIPWTKECLVGSKTMVGPLMFFTMALIMSLGIFLNNNLLFVTLAITLFFEYASREKGLVSVLSLAFWNDFHRVFKRKKGIQPLNFKYVGMITLSMLLGMIILIFMPVDRARTFSIILTILFLALGVLLTYNKISKKAAKNTVSFVIFALLSYQLTGIVFADNGGWTEGGRSVTTYVGSAGSVGAFITSAVSGIFSVAGGLLGIAVGGITGSTDLVGNWNYGSEMGAALGEDVAYVGIETVVGVKDLTVDLFTDRSLINATMDNINEEMTDFFDTGFQVSEQVSDWVEENVTTEIALETAEGMVRDINGLVSGEYAADWIKEELQEFANDPEAYVNNAIAVIEQGGTLAGEASVAVERFLNNMRNDPRAAYEIIKAISPADSIKNIIDPDKGLGERLINVPFATMDVAEMLVGFGMVNVATEAAEQGVKLGVRTAIRETAEEAGQRITQEVAEEAGQRMSQEMAEEAGQRITQEMAEEGGQRLGQEVAEEAGQRTTQEIAEEAGQRTTQEIAEEAGQRTGQEAIEETGQRTSQEVAEEAGQRTTQEATEESGQRATQEAVEESGQRTTQEAAEESGQRTTQEAAEETGQRTSQEAIEETGQRTTQEVSEEAGQRTTQEATEESGQRATQEAAEESGQRTTQEAAEESGQRTSQEAVEETGQRTTQEVSEEAGQRTTQEAAEETGQRTSQEAVEETGQRTTQEVSEEAGQRTTQEATEESGQRATQEAAEESGQRTTQEAAEESGQRTSQEAVEETGQRTTQEVSEEAGQRTTQEATEESGQRATQEAAEESGQRTTQEAAEESGQRTSQEAVEETGQRTTQEVSEEAGQWTTQEATEESGQRATQEAAEESGQRTTQEAAEESGQRTSQEAVEETGQRTTQEVSEEAGQRTTQEATEESGQRATQEATEESGQRTTQEAAEESGQRTTQEATEETTQQSVLETAEQRVENEIKNVDELPPGKKDELINAQREYDEALANAKDNTERMIDDINSGNGISKDDVINSRGSIDTRAAQGEKIGDAGRASDIPENFVEEYNRTLKDVQRSSYDDMIDDLRKNPNYKDADLRIREMRTPNNGPDVDISDTDCIYNPGDRSPENNIIPDSINADNDFTVQKFNESTGQWEEIDHRDFENIYYEKYAERSGFTPERAEELYPDGDWKGLDGQWDSLSDEEKMKQMRAWGERQGEMPTSVSHREGIREFSTERTAQLGGEAPTVKIEGIDKILSPKVQAEAGIGELIDPTQLSMAEHYKFAEPWSAGSVSSQSEALEQLNKAGDLLGKLENGYRDMGKIVPDMPANMQDALKVIGDRNLAPALREAKIQQLGYRNMEDFAEILTTRFEFLKLY